MNSIFVALVATLTKVIPPKSHPIKVFGQTSFFMSLAANRHNISPENNYMWAQRGTFLGWQDVGNETSCVDQNFHLMQKLLLVLLSLLRYL